jgi:hypothetical protein
MPIPANLLPPGPRQVVARRGPVPLRGQLAAAVTTGLGSVLFGLGVLDDFREGDHDASGGVLDGSADKGARLRGGGAGRRVVGEVQVQQPVRRGRAAVFLGPDLRRLQASQAGELAR